MAVEIDNRRVGNAVHRREGVRRGVHGDTGGLDLARGDVQQAAARAGNHPVASAKRRGERVVHEEGTAVAGEDGCAGLKRVHGAGILL